MREQITPIAEWLKQDDFIVQAIDVNGCLTTVEKESGCSITDGINFLVAFFLPPAKRKVTKVMEDAGVRFVEFHSQKKDDSFICQIMGDRQTTDFRVWAKGESVAGYEYAEVDAIQNFIIHQSKIKQEQRDDTVHRS